MDIDRLRDLLSAQVHSLSQSNRHVDLPGVCQTLGLPAPPDEGSKRQRMLAAFEGVPDSNLKSVATRLLENFPLDSAPRYDLEETLWSDDSTVVIPKKFRRDLARSIETDDLFSDWSIFERLLDRFWVLESSPLDILFGAHTLRSDIERHVVRNPGDWTTEYLFQALGAFECTDKRFALFIEGATSPDVQTDEARQRMLAEKTNQVLRPCGVELRETGEDGGYPLFQFYSFASASGRAKNIIFASTKKPDLRFSDAINNDVEIVTNAEHVLIYDRPIGSAGITWNDLQSWWADQQGIANNDEAKKSLFRRLKSCLPSNSPPQSLLFQSYFTSFREMIPEFPALLPEVWLHWDPKTVKERGAEALLRFRMDFLLLLPGGRRVVLEVDGKMHYAEDSGEASSKRYSEMVSGDRDLRLAGYDVYRFGALELTGEAGLKRAENFFRRLFRKYGVYGS
jgi:hypothetical protein